MDSTSRNLTELAEEGAARRYALGLIGAVLALVGLVALFNLLVDPFGVWRLVEIPGVNAEKTRSAVGRFAKAHAVRTFQPRAVILGTSRTRIGLDPTHPGWADGAGPAYNLAFGGATMGEVRDYFELATREAPVKVAVVGLDFWMFNASRPANEEFDAARLRSGGLVRDLPKLLLANALEPSWKTLVYNHDLAARREPLEVSQHYDGHGAWAADRPYKHRESFIGANQAYLTQEYFPPPRRVFCLADPARGVNTLAQLQQMLDLARQRHVKLTLFFSPAHAREAEVARAAGLWPTYEAWKRQVTALAAAAGTPLWDFSGYNSITTEAVPPLDRPQARMAHYWESAHYKEVLGGMILDRISGRSNPDIPADFGLRLTAADIEARLAADRAARAAYAAAQPQQVAEVARLAAESRDARKGTSCPSPPPRPRSAGGEGTTRPTSPSGAPAAGTRGM
ncbi:MAG: hypothetical protein JWQ97_2194 [Phenylobacterium sp.]|nr:hypothetical protein [Phenylobacterium sp.]